MNNPQANRQPAPWYRQPWLWFLIMLPASVVVASFVTLFLALDNDVSLVRDDYYKEGLAINRRLEQEARARELGISAELRYDGDTLAVEVHTSAIPPTGGIMVLSIVHPTNAQRDQTLTLLAADGQTYVGKLADAIDGKRHLQLDFDAGPEDSWRLRGILPAMHETLTTVVLDAG
jgi:uncharacterized protein